MEKLLIALAAGARAFADVLTTEAAVTCTAPCADTNPTPETEQPKTRKPRKTAEPETPAPAPTPEPEPSSDSVSDEQLKAAIRDLVADGRSAEVKVVIAKYGEKLTAIPPDKRKAFLADIDALSL